MGLDRFGEEIKVIIIHLLISDQEGFISGPFTCISPLTADFSNGQEVGSISSIGIINA